MDQICFNLPYHRPGIVIYTDDAKLKHDLAVYYHCAYVSEPMEDYLRITVTREFEHSLVFFNGESITAKDPLPVIERIISEHSRLLDAYYGFHAAGVVVNGQAYLFLAPTGTGKTTLVTYLVSKGFEYITDDCIVVDKESLCVQPVSSPVRLREGGIRVLNKQDVSLHTELVGDRYVYRPANRIEDSLLIGHIFFLNRNANATNVLQPVTQGMCMELLMKNAMSHQEVSLDYLTFLSRMAKTRACAVDYNDMSFIWNIIEKGAGYVS